LPLIDATKGHHILEAAKVPLTKEEVEQRENLADAAGVDTRGDWEHTME